MTTTNIECPDCDVVICEGACEWVPEWLGDGEYLACPDCAVKIRKEERKARRWRKAHGLQKEGDNNG